MNHVLHSDNTVTSKSDLSSAFPDSDSCDILAPPPSLVDIHINHNYEGQDDDDLVMSPLVIDYDVLVEEIVNIQHDQQELLACLDSLILSGMGESGDEVFNVGISAYLIDDEVTGGHSINWPYFGLFVDEVIGSLQELKEFNQRTNDLMRRIRVISAIRSPMARNSQCQCKLSNHGMARNDCGDLGKAPIGYSVADDLSGVGEGSLEEDDTTEPAPAVYTGDYLADMGDS